MKYSVDSIIREDAVHRTDDVRREYTDASDAALVVSIGRYQQAALAEAYRRHAGATFGLAKRLLNDHARAEEVVQEVFVRLWNEPSRFDPERGTLRSFLLAHTHGRSVDLIRADVSRRNREEKEARQQADGGYDIAHEVWDLALAGHVRDAMETLQQGEREAIELAYFGGLTYKEAADQLGEPEGTVKSRIRSGLKKLRIELQQVGVSVGAD
ncbi:MAG: sigma-70 family RNA polymerase sigma factor [Acidimicrobiales bacterium]|nr:MAG: sigma-70 family RNA polymerase sigma factor [Acidimicrobiales bacterium]